MSAIQITKEDFQLVCPSATMPDDGMIRQIALYFIEAARVVASIVSPALMLMAENVTLSEKTTDEDVALGKEIRKFIAVKAYMLALPHLDLVLTATGFGVVSNQNVAPASADRVERLRRSLTAQLCECLDNLREMIRHREDLPEKYRWFFRQSLFWSGEHARLFGNPDATTEDLTRHRAEISDGEVNLRHLISREMFAYLTDAVANGRETLTEKTCISLCRNFVVACAKRDESQLLHRNELIAFLDENIGDFQVYERSSAYKANHFKPYQNEKDDPCFFFG